MTDLVTRAQLTLLSRTLHVPVEELTHLEKLGAAGLHELQQRMAKAVFAEHNATFSRLSMLVPLVPMSISLPLVQRLVPPMMAGRAAGAIGVDHPRKAAEAVALMDTAYAAAAAPYMDPHTVGQLADIAPVEPVMAIINELLRRGDHVTAGPFLGYATSELVQAVERCVPDDEGLIRSASYSYSGESISIIIRHLLTGPEQRIPRLVRTIVHGSTELRLAALSVFARCDDDVVEAIGDILFEQASPEEIADLITTFVTEAAIAETLRFVAALSPRAQDRLAANPILTDRATIETIAGALDDGTDPGVWQGLLALAERTPPPTARRVATQICRLDPATLTRLPDVLAAAQLWTPILKLLATTEPDAQARLGQSWSALPDFERAEIEQLVTDLDLAEELTALTAALHPMHRPSATEVITDRDAGEDSALQA